MKKQIYQIAALASFLLLFSVSCNKDNSFEEGFSDEIELQNDAERACGMIAHMEQLLQDPDYQAFHAKKFRKVAELGDYRATCSNKVIIPVAVHYQRVRGSYDIQCLRDLAQNQIDILNADYGGTNFDISNWTNGASSLFPNVSNGEACIEFCLANKNHPGGYGIGDGDPAVTVNETRGDRDNNWSGYINIFVRPIQYLGYSPLGGAGNGDGVVIDDQAFGSAGNGCGSITPGAPYDLGRTLTHELGHYLLLDHIWGGGCGSDDGIGDTPDSSGPYYGCPANGAASCGSTDMHMNYMDYTNDACMYMFSAGQAGQMEGYVASSLGNVVANASNVCGTVDPPCTSNCPCDTPTGVSANIKGKRVSISWNAVSTANSYEVQYKLTTSPSFETEITTGTSINLRNLASGTYEYQVIAVCGGGVKSDPSPLATFTF